MSWKRTIHPVCTPECEHAPTGPDETRLVQLNATTFTREDAEGWIVDEAKGQPVHYLGVYGLTRGGDDPWPVHSWQVGGEAPTGIPPQGTAKPPTERKDTAIYRPEVWMGSGEPVGPLDMSRPMPAIEVEFPTPVVGATTTPEGSVVKPKPVADLERVVALYGWEYMTTYASGWVPHATHGRATSEDPKPSWAVRMRRGTQRAVAVRMGNAWASIWTWSGTQFFQRFSGTGEFLDAVAGALMDQPSRKTWDELHVKYPLKPTRAQWAEMRAVGQP